VTTTDVFTSVRPDIERDRWGRPMVHTVGGKPVAYTRCTTYVGCIEDTYNLSRWQMRMVATGLVDRPDLLLAASAHRDDKRALDNVCSDAMEAAKAHAAATTGTALHALAERVDVGIDVGAVPAAYVADLAAYTEATRPLKPVQIEQFTVLDALKIGGTPDRVVTYKGKRYIADIKTGTLDFGYLKIAAQLAAYARSRPYDVTTHERLEPHGAETDRGIIIHLPAGTGTCRLYWVDLLEGWNAVQVCRMIRERRAIPKRDLIAEFDAPPPDKVLTPLEPTHDVLADTIAGCTDAEAIRDLWRDNAAVWTDVLTALAKARIAALA